MSTLLERNLAILRRMEDLRALENRVRTILVEGKRDQLQRGVDVRGVPFAGIAPSTRKGRKGNGPPLAPQGPNADIVRKFNVQVERVPEGLKVRMGWPMAWIKYHTAGGKLLPRRDPTGVRERDRRAIQRALREWVMNHHG